MRYPTDEELKAFLAYIDSEEYKRAIKNDPDREKRQEWLRKQREDFNRFLDSDLAKMALRLD